MYSPDPLLDHENFDLHPGAPTTIPSGHPSKAARYVGMLFRVLADEVNFGGVQALDYTKPVIVSSGEAVASPSGVTAAEKLRDVKSLIEHSVMAHFDERDSWIWCCARIPQIGAGELPSQETIASWMNLSQPRVCAIIKAGDELIASRLEKQGWKI